MHEYYTYGIEAIGGDPYSWTKTRTGTDDANAPYVLSKTNWLGQLATTEKPGHDSATVTTTNAYESGTGRLTAVATTGQANTLYAYDAMGNVVRSGLDVGRPVAATPIHQALNAMLTEPLLHTARV